MAGFVDRIAPLPWRVARGIRAVALRFHADGCLRHASALAYASLLSLVPLLALMVAGLKGLGVQHRLEPLLLSRLALDPDVAAQVITYVDRIKVGRLGTLGAIFLVLTAVGVLSGVEASFNHIWRVRRARTPWRKATDYLSTVLVTPFLLLAALAITSSVREQGMLRLVLNTQYVGEAAMQLLRLAPVAMNVAAVAILYAVMPNRRPHLPSILLAAAVTGCAWQGLQWGYVSLQVGVARYNAIYGALSHLPVMLVWIYLSWIVILAGAEVAAVWEFGVRAGDPASRPPARTAVAAHVLLRAAEAFRDGGPGIECGALARELGAPAAAVAEVAEGLRAAGLLVAIEDAPLLVLARAPGTIRLEALAAAVEETEIPAGCDPRVRALFDGAPWRHHTLADLLAAAGAADTPLR